MTIEEAKCIARIIIIGIILSAYIGGWSAAITLRLKKGKNSLFWECWIAIHVAMAALIASTLFCAFTSWAFS